MTDQELQIRLPYDAWGPGEWDEGSDDLNFAFDEALEQAGTGSTDDPDHFDEFICFYLLGPDVEALVESARLVLTAHGLLEVATGLLTDPDAHDYEVGLPITL